MTKNDHTMIRVALGGSLVLALAGCLSVTNGNQLPQAEIDVPGVATAKGVPVVAKTGDPSIVTGMITFNGMPVAVTLDGSKSHDPDGTIQAFTWRRTDFPAASRFADGGMPPPDSGLPVFTGDPPASPTTQSISVMLSAGKYRYTLWVQDNTGVWSAPASVAFTVAPPPMMMMMP